MKFLIQTMVCLFVIPVGVLHAQPGRGGRPNTGFSTVLSSGVLPDVSGFTADGKPIALREHIQGHYTVLKSGCLTCPEFHKAYPEIETASADYASRGVKFFYIYQSLRHPELGGYVQAQNTAERLLQLAEAEKKLGTSVPWIADTLDDSIQRGLKAGSNSVYLISPEGKIVYAADRLSGDGLRNALTIFVGPVDRETSPSELDLPVIARNKQQANVDTEWLVHRPEGLVILSIEAAHPDETYFVKLRAEAEPALLETGKGRLFLGFYPDPIHDAHWNNLTPPMKYRLELPAGMSATPSEASATKGPGDSDTQPRQFWVDIDSAGDLPDINLSLHYYGCTPTMCTAMTHEYTIRFEPDDRNSRTFGFNRGQRGQKQ